MSAANHAPWTVEEGASNYRFQVRDASGHVVARIVGGLLDGGRDKAELIAAAPEQQAKIDALADALEALLKATGQIGLIDNRVEDMRTAARGALRLAGRTA